MATMKTVTEHNVAFPSKMGYGHILNIEIEKDMDNGVIASAGPYKDFDRYSFEEGNAGFKGTIVGQAANGHWYVEVSAIDPAKPPVFLINSAIIEDETLHGEERYFYNPAGSTMKAYVMGLYDIVEESDMIFDGTPAVGKAVTVKGMKLAVAAGA